MQLLFLCCLVVFPSLLKGAEAYQEIDYADNEPCSTPGDIRLKSQGSIYKIAYLQYCDPSQYKWSWVCADDWNARAAEVACRQFGALPQNYVREVRKTYLPRKSWANIMMSPKSINCRGDEYRLSDCSPVDYSDYPYSHRLSKIDCMQFEPHGGQEYRWITGLDCTGRTSQTYPLCPDPSTPDFGKVIITGNHVGDRAQFSCDSGFERVGTDVSVCTSADGVSAYFEPRAPTCRYIPDLTQCQHPATPANGRVTLSGTGIGSSAVYACNPGFELTGTVTAICTAPADRETGMATFQPSTLRTCQSTVKCPDPVAPANGGMLFSGNDVGDTAIYTCDSGFELTGEATATCTEDAGGNSASFKPAPPTCQPPVKCPDPVAPANGGMSFSGNDVGDTATYTCDSGFELTGEATATCTEDAGGNSASFQPAPPTCQSTKEMPEDSEPCSTPGAVRHYEGRIQRWAWLQYCDPNIRQWGWMCGDSWTREFGEVVCRELGYEYDKDVGPHTLYWPRYHSGPGWDNVLMSPLKVECAGTEARVSDCDIVDYNSSPYSEGEKIWCGTYDDPSFDPRVIAIAQCSATATVKCPVPVAPANGGVTYTGVNVGDSATYTCNSGFKRIGKATATCIAVTESNGAHFHPAPPTCQQK